MKFHNFIILTFLLISTFSCTGPDDQWEKLYHSWIIREGMCLAFSRSELDRVGYRASGDVYEVCASWVRKEIRSHPGHDEGKIFWQTSRQTMLMGSGDIFDRTILLYAMLLHEGIPTDDVMLILLQSMNGDDAGRYHLAIWIRPQMRILSMEGLDPTSIYEGIYLFTMERIQKVAWTIRLK